MPLALAILAAGLSSRYGRSKQIEGFGPQNISLMECALFDAFRAGIRDVFLIVNPASKALIEAHLTISQSLPLNLTYVEQRLNDLPEGRVCPATRTKPWGTAHAAWSLRKTIQTPFILINADDFYGQEAFTLLADALTREPKSFFMVGYELDKTLSNAGPVSRALGTVDSHHQLLELREHHGLTRENAAPYLHCLASMNCWGLPAFAPEALTDFLKHFFEQNLWSSTAECYLPESLLWLAEQKKQRIRVLPTDAASFGLTHAADRFRVERALQELGYLNSALF